MATNAPGSLPARKDASWSQWLMAPRFGREVQTLPRRVRLVNVLAAGALVILAIGIPVALLDVRWDWGAVWRYRQKFIDGFLLTVEISLVSIFGSVAFGAISAIVGRARFLPTRYLNRMYVDLVRCTPMVVQILLFNYVIAPAIGVGNRNVAGILILSIAYGAYISEILRSGIESIRQSQWETARALGLTVGQTYRYVVVPQAVRQVLPPMSGQLMSLVKDSSLLSYISVGELTKNAMETSNINYSALECYTLLAAGYLILTLPICFYTRLLEQRSTFAT